MKKIGFIAGAFIAMALMSISASAEKLPEKYDLREVNNALPEIFSQGNLGTCWSVASNSVYEIALRMKGIKDENGKYYKLSMYHNDWCTARSYIDVEYPGYSRSLYGGGWTDVALGYWLSGKGPIKEELVPYDESITDIYIKETMQPTIGKMVTGIKVVSTDRGVGDLAMTWADSDDIKQSIIKYGAGMAHICYEAKHQNDKYNSFFCDDIGANANHEIVVIGWDDNFPADHFNTPANRDGAWIIRNSWGDYNDENGYFYVSYDDVPFNSNPVSFITGIADKNYDNVYTTESIAGTCFDGYSSGIDTDGIEYSATVFDKTANTQNIHEVMLPLLKGTEYSVYLVDDYKDTSSLSDRKFLTSGVSDHRGYHLAQFDPVDIEGDKFAVVVSYSSSAYEKLISAVNALDVYYPDGFTKGRCYMSNNGKKWDDLADRGKVLDIYVYGSNTCKTTNVTFETDPWYSVVNVYKGDVPQYMNPDGSYDLMKGNYTYTLLVNGEESKKFAFSVDGKNDVKKISKTLNVKPFAYDGDIEIGADDPDNIEYILYYSLGSGKYASDGIKKITVNGKNAAFSRETDDSLDFKLPTSILKTAGDKLEFVVVYKNGIKDKFTAEINAGYSESGAFEKTLKEAKEICDSFAAAKGNMSEALAEKLEALSGKYNENVYINTDLHDNDMFVLGDYSVYSGINSISKNVTIKADTSPTFNKLSGWNNVIDYVNDHDNCEMTISVFDNSIVPSDFMAAVKGKNITVRLDVTDEHSYVFNGKDVGNTEPFVISGDMFLSTTAYINDSVNSDDGLIAYAKYISSPYGIPVKGHVEYKNTGKDSIYVVYRWVNDEFEKDYAFRSDGNFRISVDAGETVGLFCVGLVGDLDSTNILDNGDLKVLQKYFNGKINLSAIQFLRADVNCDGVVDKKDYKLIKKIIESGKKKDANAA